MLADPSPPPKFTHLKDYRPPSFEIEEVYLTIELHNTRTKVLTRLSIRKLEEVEDVFLHGRELVPREVKINGRTLDSSEFQVDTEGLTIYGIPDRMVLETECLLNPEANERLEGLYKSGDIFCTQCEPEGFRGISFFLDRPDAMSIFKTKIIADKKRYPILLSNGNPIASGELEGGKHFVLWEDPFKKPSYLFALVAGDLGLVQSEFTTKSRRKIDLRIYVEKGNEHLCTHAMNSLKKAMKWEENRFSLEYDLDIYMIVAVDSFNTGAMENKGLNIFNSSCILADSQTATDRDFLKIEAIVAHEYFHNWTGNRVTCRDWFQLTLKEGLTVFRDQEFSSDLHSRAVERIENVLTLREYQFPEDQGPMAHPIKPSRYLEVNNFYTSTVYEKGAEVVRMIHTILGEKGFQRGMVKYFELYDGMGVTTDDFVDAMSRGNDLLNLDQFKRWYFQGGTPQVNVHTTYDEKNATLSLSLEQSCPPTPGQDHKLPFHIPLGLGLIGADGSEIPLKLIKSTARQPFLREGVINMQGEKETFVFGGVTSRPVVSLNRHFTAPIMVHLPMSTEDWVHLLAHDTDEFNRYEASQVLGKRIVNHLLERNHRGEEMAVEEAYFRAYEMLLKAENLEDSAKALCLSLPSERALHQGHNPIAIEDIFLMRKFLKRMLAERFKGIWEKIYEETNSVESKDYGVDVRDVGKRALKNCALSYLSELGTEESDTLTYNHFKNATNMTDSLTALGLLCHRETPYREIALREFFNRWKNQTLVMQKWLSVQAASNLPRTFDDVLALKKSDIYDETIPNLFRALVGRFSSNYIHIHHESGRGYVFLADEIIQMDKMNPLIASHLACAFRDFNRLPGIKKEMMEQELRRILASKGLSKNTFEIVDKILH